MKRIIATLILTTWVVSAQATDITFTDKDDSSATASAAGNLVDDDINEIKTAVNSKANADDPALTGTVTITLGDSAGAEEIIIKDLAGTTVARIDSDGRAEFVELSTLSLGGNLDISTYNIEGVDATEFSFLDPISSVQDQLDSKVDKTNMALTAHAVTDFAHALDAAIAYGAYSTDDSIEAATENVCDSVTYSVGDLFTVPAAGCTSGTGYLRTPLPTAAEMAATDTTGNAATATALETARTIGGVSFDGSANISLPGVNETGTQGITTTSVITGKIETATDSDAHTFTSAEYHGGFVVATGAGTYTLPTAAAGYSGCVAAGQGVTAIIGLLPATGDYLVVDGVRGTAATELKSDGSAGDKICFVAANADDWYVTVTGTWAE